MDVFLLVYLSWATHRVIDGRGEECAEPPFPIDEETRLSFLDHYFVDPITLMVRPKFLLSTPAPARATEIEQIPQPTRQQSKRTRVDDDDDDDAPSAGPSKMQS